MPAIAQPSTAITLKDIETLRSGLHHAHYVGHEILRRLENEIQAGTFDFSDGTWRPARLEKGRLAEPIQGIGDVGHLVLYPGLRAVLVVSEGGRQGLLPVR